MALTIAKKQNLLYAAMIFATIAVTILTYRATQEKWLYYRQAENAFYAEQFEEAILYYQQAFSLGVTQSNTYAHLADAYVATGNFKKSLSWYRKYLDLYPQDADTRLSYANALNWSGNLVEAKKEYQKVLEQNEMDQHR